MVANNDTNMSDIGPTAEKQQITTFIDDTPVESYEKPLMSSSKAWTSIAEDSPQHDIVSILRRPVLIETGQFNNAFISLSLKFPDIILQKSLNVVKKLDYFTFLRANVKVKILFNATPFMSGRYWMYFSPFDTVSNRSSELLNLANTTGYPGIEIDIASNAPVEIKIPYCSPLSHYNLIDTHSNMGELFIVPLNDIQSGVSPLSNGAHFEILAWFEDVELAMPTSVPVSVPEPRFEAQIGSEEHQATSGPTISGTANIVANVASSIGNSIPSLGKWLRPVEWVSRAISGTASSFGWNKPTNLDKNMPFINVPAKGYTHADGIDLSSKLSTMPDNGLTMENGLFSTEIDEMDLSYVTSKSCIFKANIPWLTTSLFKERIYKFNVTPGLMIETAPTTLAFVSSMFKYWRGGLKFRLTAAKTAFHTGRLRISYHPGVYDGSAVNLIVENTYNWILDLSVSSEIEFTIPYVSNVPWKEVYCTDQANSAIWNEEKYSTGFISIDVITQLRAASDTVALNVPLNMWISADEDFSLAIPDFGSYVIGVEGGGDRVFEAQIFNQTSSGIEHNEQLNDQSSLLFPKSSMGITTAEELCIGEKISSLRQLIKRFAITSRGYKFPYVGASGARAFPGPVALGNDNFLFNQLTLDPAYFGKKTGEKICVDQNILYPVKREADGSYVEIPVAASCEYPTMNPLHYISYLYRFYRGGRRYKLSSPTTNCLRPNISGTRRVTEGGAGVPNNSYTAVSDRFYYDDVRSQEPMIVKRDTIIKENSTLERPTINTFTSPVFGSLFEHYVYPDLNGTLEFEVPYYGQTPISLVGEGDILSTEGPLIRRSLVRVRRSEDPRGLDIPMLTFNGSESYPAYVPNSSVYETGGMRNTFGAYTLFEAAADDFTFGYLIGAPRIVRVTPL